VHLGLGGKTALITGGSKGIGFACAKALDEEGCRVAIVSRSNANVDRACNALSGAKGFCADLTDAREAAALVDQVQGAIGPIDILVNSAGAARRTPPDQLTPDAWRSAMDAKFFSYINAIDPVIKGMAARGAGVVVNIIGNGGKVASPIHLPGGSANAALMLATAGLASAYAGAGIRVLGISPGLTDTERVAGGMEADAAAKGITVEEALAQSVARIPIGRMARPEEIAAFVAFAVSDRASYLTGVSITMDGAQTATIV
jgi:NAD(P)-dependent dehydrogenase (short-subunit alcohol dehydrogenase family)